MRKAHLGIFFNFVIKDFYHRLSKLQGKTQATHWINFNGYPSDLTLETLQQSLGELDTSFIEQIKAMPEYEEISKLHTPAKFTDILS